ncbi:hypothetical protein B0T16DRAFT_454093 [Cercophora newfieldiana]|uniref:CBF1-interacting co-repressor CIR N-terminal domain-containing protein n=1 Tax=Cercophora newfieldiana TaxID=92897 RepID=A0AA40CV14_9PEZI|nr:hypothetical protein B0T16DRAFT_454093 [Cercophora newfieldiana]
MWSSLAIVNFECLSTKASHLLGKKSWNVYNADNIARVQRDEAAARAREEADEQRMQEVDAARRLAILRGETPPPLEDKQEHDSEAADRNTEGRHERARDRGARKRKRHGEDDTDFEMRVAREEAETGTRASRELLRGPSSSSLSLVDRKGHISLFDEEEAWRAEKKEDLEREAAKKKRKAEEPYQMRLVDAAGRVGTRTGPWYATPDGDASGALVPSKDAFGNDDPRRKVREAARLDASDPLAMMKRGAAKSRDGRIRKGGEEKNAMIDPERIAKHEIQPEENALVTRDQGTGATSDIEIGMATDTEGETTTDRVINDAKISAELCIEHID